MTKDEILEALETAGAVRQGHFELSSGLHSDTYIQTALVLEHPYMTKALATEAAASYQDEDVDVVVAPAVGGIVFGYAVADALGARFIYTEREDGKMTLRRNFEIHPGEKVLVAEDVVTTGGSVGEVVKLARAAGGDVVGVVALVDRGGPRDFDVRFDPVLSQELVAYEPDECPMCSRLEPVDKPGSRRLAAQEAAEAD